FRAHRPPPARRGVGFPLLLRPGGPTVPKGRARPRRGPKGAGRESFRVGKGLLRPRPVPGPPLSRDRPPHRAGHGRIGSLRRDCRPAARPHRYPGIVTGQARSAASRRPGDDPADRPGDHSPAHHPARPARPCRALVELAPLPPTPPPLPPPPPPARPPPCPCPRQLAHRPP